MTLLKGHNSTEGDHLAYKIRVNYFMMTNLFTKFQNCYLFFCNGRISEWTDGRMDGQAQSNMPLQLFQRHCQK